MILLLPYLEVQAANAMTTPWIVNSAPVMACTLFAHNLGRHIGAFPTGTAIIHHGSRLLGEWFYGRFYPQQRRGAVFIDGDDYSSKNKYALSLQPTASCHLTLSLVLEFSEAIDLAAVRRFLATARLAGGQIVGHEEPEFFEDRHAFLASAHRSGYWLVERQDLLEGTDDPLTRMIELLGTRPRRQALVAPASAQPAGDEGGQAVDGEDDEDAYFDLDELETASDEPDEPLAALPLSWLTPTTLGYAAITDFQHREFVRQGSNSEDERYPHAFAEPMVGLVQYVSRRAFGDRPIPFWRHYWPQDDVFVLRQAAL